MLARITEWRYRSRQNVLVTVAISVALAGLGVAPSVAAQTRAIDGDTLQIGDRVYRLWGIDAPEALQFCVRNGEPWACGSAATAALSAMIEGRRVVCLHVTADRYGRSVAKCSVDGDDLSARMVRDGWALAFVRYSNDYVAQEGEARAARRGMWSGKFAAPWEWRSKHSEGIHRREGG